VRRIQRLRRRLLGALEQEQRRGKERNGERGSGSGLGAPQMRSRHKGCGGESRSERCRWLLPPVREREAVEGKDMTGGSGL
jgi:hypothetical protein